MTSKYRKAVKKRASDRAIVTRHVQRLEELTRAVVGSEEALVHSTNLKASVDDLQDAMAKMERSHDDVVCEANDDEAFTADVEEHADFVDRALRARQGALAVMAAMDGAAVKPQVYTSSAASGSKISLPKLELPKFGGDVLDWTSFWDSFHAAIGSQEMPPR
jgi:hypothetical protein